jgi:ATP-dependent Clp protease ATP-binding subunit ClpA
VKWPWLRQLTLSTLDILFTAMFERYTEPSRRVIFYSRYFAAQAGSPEIETEHLLLGLLRTDMVLAQRFLGSPWVAEQVWREVEHKKPVRPPISPGGDLKLSAEAKHVLRLAADVAERFSSKKICTEHLLLGLLHEEGCFAAELLERHGVQLASTREELGRNPHDDSAKETFVREPDPLPQEVMECQTRLRSIVKRTEQAIANHDFVTARSCSDEERAERDNLRSLYQQHGLQYWIFE